MKTNKLILAIISLTVVAIYSCSKSFLDQPPQGVYDEAALTNKTGVNGLLINAYATLDGQTGTWYAGASNWLWGSVTAGDAYKGSEPTDQVDGNPVMRWEIQASNPYLLNKWNGTFDGIGMANQVLRIIANVTDMSEEEIKQATAEARFLRGHHHFEGVKMWGKIPYVDETINVEEFKTLTNDASIWPQIEEDLKFAYDNLDEEKPNIGRVNKWAAGAYLAKAYMFQKKFTEAKALYDVIIVSGKTPNGIAYKLATQYHSNFRVTSEHNSETVFSVEASYGDGSTTNGNYDNALNYPHGSGSKPGGCCGFFQPSQTFVNSFKTDGAGLPDVVNYNATDVTSDIGLLSSDAFTPYGGNLDPRLDWTVGRRGVPYLDWGLHPGRDWIRKADYGGPFSPIKNTYYEADFGATAGIVGWGWANNALNYTIMRFADVLLMAAEAEVEVGSLTKALEYVNLVRNRAKASVVPGSSAAYKAEPYASLGSQANARDLVRFERKLELGMEGHRFFDLVRWGIADVEINAYLTKEAVRMPNTLANTAFVKGKHEVMPIPDFALSQSIVDGKATLTQNPGY